MNCTGYRPCLVWNTFGEPPSPFGNAHKNSFPLGRSSGWGHGEQDQKYPERDLLWQNQGYRQRPSVGSTSCRSQQPSSVAGDLSLMSGMNCLSLQPSHFRSSYWPNWMKRTREVGTNRRHFANSPTFILLTSSLFVRRRTKNNSTTVIWNAGNVALISGGLWFINIGKLNLIQFNNLSLST